MRDGDEWVPVGTTETAKDKADFDFKQLVKLPAAPKNTPVLLGVYDSDGKKAPTEKDLMATNVTTMQKLHEAKGETVVFKPVDSKGKELNKGKSALWVNPDYVAAPKVPVYL